MRRTGWSLLIVNVVLFVLVLALRPAWSHGGDTLSGLVVAETTLFSATVFWATWWSLRDVQWPPG